MNVVGFLVTMLNISSFEDNGIPIKDIVVRVDEVGNIKNELINENKFSLEDFRETGYYRRGNVGRYMSHSCRDYLYSGNVVATDEGVCISLLFADSPRPSTCQSDQYQSYYGNGYTDDQANNLNEYHARRTKRDMVTDRK